MKQFKNYDKEKSLKKIKEALLNRLYEYQNVLNLIKNDINIINICNDLISTAKNYILSLN